MSHYSYNRSVTKEARRQFITWSLVVVGWFAAPIVKAYLDGTPLHGLPGILRFWKLLALSSIPVWAVVGIVGGSFAVFLGCARRKRMSHDHDLRVVVSEMPQPQWGIGAIANVPCLNLHLEARLSHRSEESLEIVKAYLQGTEPTGPFLPIVVAAPSGGRGVIHFCVTPVISKEGQELRRRVILIDQYGNKHRTAPVRFRPAKTHPFGSSGNPINCLVCSKPISMMEFAESSSIPAHKTCVR